MPHTHLCPDCQVLYRAQQPQAAHVALRPVLDLGEHWLFRCDHCNAFATPSSSPSGWSFNLLGQPLPSPSAR